MKAKKVRNLVEAYASMYSQVIAEAECECEEDESEEQETPEMNGKKKGKKEKEEKEEEKEEEMKEERDLFDTILEYLVAEGYADTNKAALAIMANMSEEWKQDIMEISQKTATRAYAASSTGEFEGQDSPRDVERTDNLRKHIKRKFGNKAAQHADRAAHSMTFGRKGAGGMPPKP